MRPESVKVIVAFQLSWSGSFPPGPTWTTGGRAFSLQPAAASARTAAATIAAAPSAFTGYPRLDQVVEVDDAERRMRPVDNHQLGDVMRLHGLEGHHRELVGADRLGVPGHHRHRGKAGEVGGALEDAPQVAVGDDAGEPARGVED